MKKAKGNRDKENKSHQIALRGSLQFCSLPWRTSSHSEGQPGFHQQQHSKSSPARAWCFRVYLLGKTPGRGRSACPVTHVLLKPKPPRHLPVSDPWSHCQPDAQGKKIQTPGNFPNVFAYKALVSSSRADWLTRGQGKLTTAIFTLTFAIIIKCYLGTTKNAEINRIKSPWWLLTISENTLPRTLAAIILTSQVSNQPISLRGGLFQ